MVLGGLEREREAIQRQHDDAVASLGQAQVGERIEVLSKGERFSLIEPPTAARRAGGAEARADRGGGAGRRRRLRPRLHRADRAPQPLDPPAGRHRQRPRHPAARHRALHPDPARGALEARRRRGGAGADRGGDPGGALRGAQPLRPDRRAAAGDARAASPPDRARGTHDAPARGRPLRKTERWNASRPPSRKPRSCAATTRSARGPAGRPPGAAAGARPRSRLGRAAGLHPRPGADGAPAGRGARRAGAGAQRLRHPAHQGGADHAAERLDLARHHLADRRLRQDHWSA